MTRLSALVALNLLLACSSGDTEPGAAEADPGKQRIQSFWGAFRQANQYRLQGDLDAAAAGYRVALELDPRHEESLFQLGGVQEQTGDYPEAIDAYKRLIEINPASGRGHTQLAELLSRVAPGVATDYDRAQQLLDRAVKLNPEQAGPFLQLGRLSLNRGDREAALEYFRIAARSGSPEGHAGAGFTLLMMDERDEASQAFGQALGMYRRERQLSGEGISAEGDVRLESAKPLTALERAGLSSMLHLDWLERKAARPRIRRMQGVTPSGRASAADFDNDGLPDLLVTASSVALYRNAGGRFVDVTSAAGLSGISGVFSSSWADVDRDGDQDLYLLGAGENRLFRNRGDSSFGDATAGSGLAGSRATSGAIFFDHDGDNRLDLLEFGSSLHLFRGEGSTWTPVGLPPMEGAAVDAVVEDFDRNGRPDIFVLRWRKPPVLLLNQNNGELSDNAPEAGLASIRGDHYSAVSIDYNKDGFPDLLISSHAPFGEVARSRLQPRRKPGPTAPRLFLNDGGGRFQDASTEAGLVSAYGTVQVVAADFDSDTWPDILLLNGSFDALRLEQTVILRNRQGKGFEESALLPPSNHTGGAVADFDSDGTPDLYLAPNPRIPSPVAGPCAITP